MFKLGSLFFDIKGDPTHFDRTLATAEQSSRAAMQRMARQALPVAGAGVGLAKGTALAYALDRGPGTRVQKLGRAAYGTAEGAVVGHYAHRIAGEAAGMGAFGLAKAPIDWAAGKLAGLVIKPRVDASGLAGSVKAAWQAATAPLRLGKFVAHIAVKVGIEAAQIALFRWIQRTSGRSTLGIIVDYAALRVSLAIAARMWSAMIGTAKGLALLPIRVSLAALKTGLRAAVGLVKGFAHQAASLMMAPVRAAGNAFQMLAPGAMLGGLVGVPAAIGGATLAAANLNETVSKARYGFHDAAGGILADADRMAARFGMSRQTFIDAASGLGLIAKGAGYSEAAAAQLGSQFTRLAADASSFYNLPLEDALQKIQSGLVGEAEPLRTLGVLLTEDAVKAQATRMGFHALHGEFSAGEKVQARAALILAGLADAQGDLARTSDSLKNRLRELWGRFENLAATIGGYLLPAATTLANVFSGLAQDLEGKLRTNAGVFAAWAGQLQRAAEWIGVLYRHAGQFREIGGLLFKDLGKNLWEVVKAGLTNLANYASYFGKVLGQEIRKAIVQALHQAFPKLVSAWDRNKELGFLPPKLVKPQFTMDPKVSKVLEDIAGGEQLRKALAAGAGALERAWGVIQGARGGMQQGRADAEAERARRRRAAESAQAQAERDAAAVRAWRKRPRSQRDAEIAANQRRTREQRLRWAAAAKQRLRSEAAARRDRAHGLKPKTATGAQTIQALDNAVAGVQALATGGLAGPAAAAGVAAAQMVWQASEAAPHQSEVLGFSEFARKLGAQQFEEADATKDNTKAIREHREALNKNTDALKAGLPARLA